jgi:hypothetical protein
VESEARRLFPFLGVQGLERTLVSHHDAFGSAQQPRPLSFFNNVFNILGLLCWV